MMKKSKDGHIKNPYWKTFVEMESRVKQMRNLLEKDLSKEEKNWEEIAQDSKELLLLLGECSYIMKECIDCKKKGKWQ